MSIWQKIKTFFNTTKGPTILEQFKEIIEEEKTVLKNLEVAVEASVDKVEETVKTEFKAVNDQITDAVTQAKAVVKRAKTSKGRFKADDKVTLKVNEAWEGGVAPAKKTRKKKK
jgi:hypothetical protein